MMGFFKKKAKTPEVENAKAKEKDQKQYKRYYKFTKDEESNLERLPPYWDSLNREEKFRWVKEKLSEKAKEKLQTNET